MRVTFVPGRVPEPGKQPDLVNIGFDDASSARSFMLAIKRWMEREPAVYPFYVGEWGVVEEYDPDYAPPAKP